MLTVAYHSNITEPEIPSCVRNVWRSTCLSPMLSIVLPTFNEAHNIAEVTQRIVAALSSRPEPFEIIIVDDGNDETAAIAQRLADEKAFRLQVIRRPRRLGLATAVVAGWQRASGSILGAMDADLQHPPELLCSLADLISSGQYNIAIASRCVPGSSTKGFPWHRSFLSGMARWMGNLAVPRTNRVSQPMSGMFLMHAEVVRGLELKPLG